MPFLLAILALIFLHQPMNAEEECDRLQTSYNYRVEFQNVTDSNLLLMLNSASQLISLQDSPPPTAAALKRRIENDIPNLLKALQSLAYYNARVDFTIDDHQTPLLINITVETGPIYPLASFILVQAENTASCTFDFDSICLQDLEIEIGAPALPEEIVDAEDNVILLLEKRSYPLAKITQREVIADQTNKSISVILHVDTGPAATFGITEVSGDKTLLLEFFEKKIDWEIGEPYDPKKITRTINALEVSGLFNSINITHGEEIQADGSLPMFIDIKEAKSRSIGFGVGYATDLGFGINADWENRNMRGLGDKLSVVANVWQIKQEGYVRYIQPDFGRPHQDLIWQVELEHEITKGFRETSLNFSAILERQVNDQLRFSYGGKFSILRNSHSNNNRDFNLWKIPFQIMWNTTTSLLDPTKGVNIHFKTTPALQTLAPCFAYMTHVLTSSIYKPLDEDRRYVLAAKATFGSIWGCSDRRLPPSERFYAGSDTLLRGYRYLTVSPLLDHRKPIGGRSMMIYSFEARIRVYDPFAFVFFYDIGNVYYSSIPQFNHKQLQSAGIGLRYHTPVGPIRLDFAVPLNPRRHLDRPFQLYFSIGQAF